MAGGLASAIFVYLAAQAKLPMQAALQAYYVGMSVYGWLRWSKQGTATETPGFWPLRAHLVALPVTLVASALAARWLAAETQAAWPFLDSATTFVSLLATFLVARKRIENWLYFLAADAVMVFLFAAQGLVLRRRSSARISSSPSQDSSRGCAAIARDRSRPDRVARLARARGAGPGGEALVHRARGRRPQRDAAHRRAARRGGLRLREPRIELPGVDREREIAVQRAAAAVGLAPQVIAADASQGWLLMEHLQLAPWAHVDFAVPAKLYRLGEQLARCMRCPPRPRGPPTP